MEPMKILFSGGPADGKQIVIPDNVLEYHFPVIPDMDWNITEFASDNDKLHPKVARYRSTGFKAGSVDIFEFVGIA